MKVNKVAPADGESSRRLVGIHQDIREPNLQTNIGSLPFKLKSPSALDVVERRTVIALCAITMLMTGCMLPPLPGFRVAADGPSRYYNNGAYYDNTPYYDSRPYYGDQPYYGNRSYYGNRGY